MAGLCRVLAVAAHAGEAAGSIFPSGPTVPENLKKTWRVAAPDTEPPKPSQWTLDIPRPGTLKPLVVHLGQPVGSTAKDLTAVASPTGERLQGVSALADGETTWRFVPRAAWRVGGYRLMTHPELEDPAGNRVCAKFEAVDVSAAACDAGTATPFAVTARP